MNISEVNKRLLAINCSMRIDPCGDPDYMRGSISYGESHLGRIVFRNQHYQHIKWQGRQHGEINRFDFVQWSWRYIYVTNKILGADVWASAVTEAEAKSAIDLQIKKDWRKANPSLDQNGHPKKRRPLKGRDPRNYLPEIILVNKNLRA